MTFQYVTVEMEFDRSSHNHTALLVELILHTLSRMYYTLSTYKHFTQEESLRRKSETTQTDSLYEYKNDCGFIK